MDTRCLQIYVVVVCVCVMRKANTPLTTLLTSACVSRFLRGGRGGRSVTMFANKKSLKTLCNQNFCARQRVRSAIFMISKVVFLIRPDRK
jgi:hypothetical protein